MTLVNPPTAVAPFDTGRLAVGISAAATTITVAPIYKTVNGVRTKQGLDTTSGLALITQGDFTERISFEGATVNATTKVTTLTTCTRGLSTTSTTPSFSGGTGRAWPKGAKITVVADASYFQSSVYTTVPNSFSAKQTFAAGADFTSVTRPPKLPTLSQVQENALTPEEGMMWKNSDTGTNRQYVSGSIVDIGDAGTPNGSTTVAGKFEEATVAEQGSATATGATGARLVPAVANLVKTSSGAGDENKIPIIGALGNLALGFLGTGTPAASKYVDGASGAWTALPTAGSAVSLAKRYVSTTAITTTSTSFTDIDGTNMTVDVVCDANTIVCMWLVGTQSHSATSTQISYDFDVEGVKASGGQSQGLVRIESSVSNGAFSQGVNVFHAMVPGSGTHTIKPQWLTASGTATLNGGGTKTTTFIVLKIQP